MNPSSAKLINCLQNHLVVDTFGVVKTMEKACEKGENIVVKRENAGNLHFLLFLQGFQTDPSSGSLS